MLRPHPRAQSQVGELEEDRTNYYFLGSKSRYAKFILPPDTTCTVSTLTPFGSFTSTKFFIMFQWCHCRQAMGSAVLLVETMLTGPVSFCPFRSNDISPPRFEV